MEHNITKALGQYPTPSWVAEAIVERYFPQLSSADVVVEPSCGPGAFLSAIPPEIAAIGVEIDPQVAAIARETTGRQILVGDFCTVSLSVQPTVFIGNPPFNLKTIDSFLDRAYQLLPQGGQAGFVLPAYAFQTAARVVEYSKRWSLMQEMIPRNIYPGLSLPLIFAMFLKDARQALFGFAFYQETADVNQLPKNIKDILCSSTGSIWKSVVKSALFELGGEGEVSQIYEVIEGKRPTTTKFWREKVRQTLRRYAEDFAPTEKSRYKLVSA